MKDYITVIGGGLAGTEAAYQIAKKGIKVKLYEMKPIKFSPAHSNKNLAEIVCSNSFKSNLHTNACGLLKEELRILDSLLIKIADENSVPAGQALAVDREKFAHFVTENIKLNENIEIINMEVGGQEASSIERILSGDNILDNVNNNELADIANNGIVIVATGPLTSDSLANEIAELTGDDGLHFYDAAAPIVSKESINMDIAFWGDRYDQERDKDEDVETWLKNNDKSKKADYVNLPMNKEEYEKFVEELINADVTELHEFEKKEIFEGCMPIEIMAKRGKDTLRFGPLKPVGFTDPRTGYRPYAVVQLRQDNNEGSIFNMVGFQTNLKFGEQKRVFSLIPGLEKADFVKYGVMHRNTFINSPKLLDETYNFVRNKNIYFAGQITGVEGYVESISSGLITGINAAINYMLRNNMEINSLPRSEAKANKNNVIKINENSETKEKEKIGIKVNGNMEKNIYKNNESEEDNKKELDDFMSELEENNEEKKVIDENNEYKKELEENINDLKESRFCPSKYTMIGSLARYISTPNNNFQPMNANFGILPELKEKIRDKKLRYQRLADRALETLKNKEWLYYLDLS